MFNRSTWMILLLAVLAAAAGGWLQHRSQLARQAGAEATIEVGAMLPAMRLKDMAGRPHALADYRGRRVLINLWASWCAPCVREMPALAALARAHPDIVVVGVAMDDPAHVRTFLADHPVDYPILLGQSGPPSTARRLGDADEVLPYSVLLDSDGRVRQARRGPLDEATLRDWVARELRK